MQLSFIVNQKQDQPAVLKEEQNWEICFVIITIPNIENITLLRYVSHDHVD